MDDTWDGRPENPERDGWHIVYHKGTEELVPRYWQRGHWHSGLGQRWIVSPETAATMWDYVGLMLTPAEVAAREAAAAAKEREACAQIAEEVAKDCKPFEMTDGWATAMTVRDDIRARGKEPPR